ncbi:hypothetical protein ACPEEZ_14495 [Frigoribacterium sp. 2-23]|uniref:hypothetical protein n=1 Tax=Frigoribacterium sp. 2-23 TaxID=3415006 RepID=UPI003C6F2962
MNTEHDDDTGRSWNSRPPAGDELNRMLVTMKQDVLTRVAAEPRTAVTAKRRRKTFGITFGVVALLAVGGASGAIALGMIPSPFEGLQHAAPSSSPAPSTTPTPKPTVSAPPVAAPNYDPPAERVPLSCAQIGDALSIPSLLRAPTSFEPRVFEPQDAALTAAGLTTCSWQSQTPDDAPYGYALVTMNVVPAPAAGRDWISSKLAAGGRSTGVGEASAVTCETSGDAEMNPGEGCTMSVVTSDFWFEFEFFVTPGVTMPGQATLSSAARGVADALAPLKAGPEWTMPPTTWGPVTNCDTLAPRPSMSSYLTGPLQAEKATPLEPTAISDALGDGYACRWLWAGDGPPPSNTITDIAIGVAPGGRWAYDGLEDFYEAEGYGRQVIESEESVTVAGAQEAVRRCGTIDGYFCWLDVLDEDTWIQFGFGDGFVTDADKATLITIAEAVLARHEGGD